MSYVLNYSGGTITIPLGQANTSGTPLTLIGRNWTSSNIQQGYGQALNQNFVSMLENFAAATQPTSPLEGQFWYDTSTSEVKLNLGTPSSPTWAAMYSTNSNIDHINNGTSNVFIPVAGGNVNTSVGGNANIFVVTGTGANVFGTFTSNTSVSAPVLISTVAAGTPPFSVTSSTRVINLNAAQLDGFIPSTTPNNLNTIVVRNGTTGAIDNNLNGNVTGTYGNFTTMNGNLNATTISGSLTTGSQPNITSVGTLTTLNVTGTVTATNFVGNISGNATLAGSVTTNAQPNITSVGTLTGLTSTGVVNFTGTSNVSLGQVGNVKILGGTNGSFLVTNGSGDLSWSTASSSISVGSVTAPILTTGAVGTAGSITGAWTLTAGSTLQATYADLAEYYTIDKKAGPGTVVEFGGSAEITVCDTDMSRRIAGVVSTDPAFLMNAEGGTPGQIREPVALQGRVPCKVVGKVTKGDLMVSAGNGYARAEEDPVMGSVIGKALVNKDTEEMSIIEVVVGRL